MFKSLFKPKWQHADPRIRLQAVQALDHARAADRDILHTVARTDADAPLRRVVLKRITDLDLLLSIALEDTDAEVRSAALARFLQLMCGSESGTPGLAERMQRLSTLTDHKQLEEIARHGVERELRLAALQRVERDALLGDVAVHDADPELRFWAAQRITQKSTLERVAKNARGKDKRVSGVVREKLEIMAADAERPTRLRQQAKQACAALEALARSDDWATVTGRRERIEGDWRAMIDTWDGSKDGAFDADLSARFAAARSTCDAAFAQHEQAIAQQRERAAQVGAIRERKQRVCEQLAVWVAELQQLGAGMPVDETTMAARMADYAQSWREAGALPTAEEQTLHARYAALSEQVTAVAGDLSRLKIAHAQLHELDARAHALLEQQDEVPSQRDIAALEKQWHDLQRPVEFALDTALEQRVTAALAQLRARRDDALLKIRENVDAFKRAVGELQAAIDNGQSQAASELLKSTQQIFDALPEHDAAMLRKQDVFRRWHSAAKTVRDLYAWKRWAGAPVKEQLVAEMEALAQQLQSAPDGKHDYPAIAQQIQNARDHWQKLGATDNAGAKALWERFNTACETAHAPCAAYFAQQRAQRAANAAQKEAICVGLEQFIAQTDAGNADWKQAERLLRGAREEWNRIGPVERAQNKKLGARFRGLMDGLAARLQDERKRNHEKKAGLIQRMTQLADSVVTAAADSSALRDAIVQAKQLQSQWKELGQSTESNRLWNDFRAASDRIFAQRQALADAQDQQRRANLERKQALCAQIEEFAVLSGDSLRQARSKVQQVKAEFERAGPVPRDDEATLMQRFKQANRAFETRLRDDEQQQRAQADKLLEQKARLCDDVERAAEEAVAGTIDHDTAKARTRTAQETWQGLGSLADAIEQPLQQRFQTAVDLMHTLPGLPRDHAAQQLAQLQLANLAAQQQLCLRLEIAAGLESPPEAQQQRMKYQVELLAQRMKTGQFQSADTDAAALLTQWWMTGAVPPAQRAALQARFARVSDALRNPQKGSP